MISISILQFLETPTVVTSPRSQLLDLQDGKEEKIAFQKHVAAY